MPGLLLHQVRAGWLERHSCPLASWQARDSGAVRQWGWLITVCLLQAVLDINLVFQLLKSSNGFKKLSGDMENEKKTE